MQKKQHLHVHLQKKITQRARKTAQTCLRRLRVFPTLHNIRWQKIFRILRPQVASLLEVGTYQIEDIQVKSTEMVALKYLSLRSYVPLEYLRLDIRF